MTGRQSGEKKKKNSRGIWVKHTPVFGISKGRGGIFRGGLVWWGGGG